MSALPEDDEERGADERLERGHEHAPSANQLDVAGDVFAIGLVEASNFGFFLGISTDDAHAREMLLNLSGERGQGSLDHFVEIMDDFAEMADSYRYDRHGQEHPKRQGRRQAGHDDDGENHGDQRLAGVHDAGAEDHAHVVEIVGGTRHELARAIADVELRLHQKKAIEKAAAEVEFDIARNADEHPARGERHQAFQQHANNQDETVDAQSAAAMRCVKGNVAAEPITCKGFRVGVVLERSITAGKNVGQHAGGERDIVADNAGQRKNE